MDEKSEKLRNIIKSQYKSIRSFSESIGIPNTTLVTALKNGIGGMAVEKVITICEKLSIDVKTFDPLPKDPNYFYTTDEKNVIKKYRQLDADGKERITNMLDFEISQINRKDEQYGDKAI